MTPRRTRSAKAHPAGSAAGGTVGFVRAEPWVPPADVVETDREYVVVVDIAGADAADIEVTYEAGGLTVSGVRREHSQGRRRLLVSEIRLGPFERRLALPGPVDDGVMRARYDRGLLRVTLRKAAHAAVRIVRN
jgi:HSP20 family protein